jgi:hypothetical protein
MNKPILYLLVYCSFFITIRSVFTQQSLPNVIKANRIHSKIQINGGLDEPEWNLAQHITKFTQQELSEGEPATESTEVAILYDEINLYFGVWCYDSEPKKIIAKKMEWDFEDNTDDVFKLIIDTYHDKRNGYRFTINPNGAMADAIVIDNGNQTNEDWDGVWIVATQTTDEGWFAEFKIPFSTLKYQSGRNHTWGINFARIIRRKLENVRWQGWSRDAKFNQVSRAGTLTGLTGIGNIKLLEFRPYTIGGVENRPGLKSQSITDFGGDINYLITPKMKLNLTINTDFAQVESDKKQINLSRFSLSYPEKRKFFLEGKNFFDFDLGDRIRPFYSRRIGLAQDGSEVPILGGARILGKQGNSTFGGMLIQTGKKDSIKSSNYSVIRYKHDIFEESTIGIIGINMAESNHFNATYGMDFHYSTSSLFNDKNFSAGVTFVKTFTSDISRKTGNAHKVYIEYPNDFIEFGAMWEKSGHGFNPEVGFLKRDRFQLFSTELSFNPRPRFIPWIHQIEFKPLEINYYIDDKTGEMQSFDMEIQPMEVRTKTGDSFDFAIVREAENIIKDFEIQDDFIIPINTYWFTRYKAEVESYEGRPFSLGIELGWGDFYTGSCTSLESRIDWRINKHFRVSTEYEKNIISFPTGNFQTNEIGGRIRFAIHPRLFGSFFGQWNDEDEQVLINFRINWIPNPGSDFFFVFNQSIETGGSHWIVSKTTVLSKFVWRFVL